MVPLKRKTLKQESKDKKDFEVVYKALFKFLLLEIHRTSTLAVIKLVHNTIQNRNINVNLVIIRDQIDLKTRLVSAVTLHK